jgi:hypothetical protein
MKVAKLTISQKNLLIDQTFDGYQYFNPTLDGNNDWFISTQEVELCTAEEFLWVKVLPLIDYIPPADPFGN